MMTTMKTSKPVIDMNYSEICEWFEALKDEYASWGGFLREPYPALLTTWYAERVVDRSFPASKEIILAAKRHLKDLKKQGTRAFPWVFDEEKAWRPIRFIEKKCKPSKGDYKQIVLQPWQHFALGSLFGWVHKDTGVRRFREGLLFMGRKNGKTTMCSGTSGYLLGFDGENGADIYVLANSKKQSGKLFDETKAMIKASPYLMKRFDPHQYAILYPDKNCTMVAMSAEKHDKDGENAHGVIFDELHEYKDYDLISLMKQSRGTRRQPLIIYITTAGVVLDGPLMDYYETGERVLSGLMEDDRTFYFMAKQDKEVEADSPELWIKANPNFFLMKIPELVTDWQKDRKNSSERVKWITKQFNLFSDTSEMSFLDAPTIMKNNKVKPLEELEGLSCFGGYDLSETEDFTAAALEFPLPDNYIFFLVHFWIPQKRFDRDPKKEKLQQWINDSDLAISGVDHVDYKDVLNWFIDQGKHYKILKVGYDRAKALFLNDEMANAGFETEKVIQGFLTLGGPMQNFKELMLDGKVIFNNSRIFRWNLSNVQLIKDRNDNFMPKKSSKNRKIDGFAAALDAHTVALPELANVNIKPKVKYYSVKDLLRR
jgi:phage terminase large subunit-like protein